MHARKPISYIMKGRSEFVNDNVYIGVTKLHNFGILSHTI